MGSDRPNTHSDKMSRLPSRIIQIRSNVRRAATAQGLLIEYNDAHNLLIYSVDEAGPELEAPPPMLCLVPDEGKEPDDRHPELDVEPLDDNRSAALARFNSRRLSALSFSLSINSACCTPIKSFGQVWNKSSNNLTFPSQEALRYICKVLWIFK